MPKLLYTVAPSNSGKSTFANDWVQKSPMRVIVSSDDIRLAMHGKVYEPLAETYVFATKHVMIRALLARGFDVLVDGTHTTEISIKRILEIDLSATHLFFDTPIEICVERAMKNNRADLVPTIQRQFQNLAKLTTNTTLDETIEKIRQCVLDRGLYKYDNI